MESSEINLKVIKKGKETDGIWKAAKTIQLIFYSTENYNCKLIMAIFVTAGYQKMK